MPALPVIVGVGQLRHNRARLLADAREPAALMEAAIRLAIADSTAEAALAAVDSLDAVRVMTWQYDDLPGLLAAKLGLRPRRAVHGEVGGNTPIAALDAAAARIAAGESRVALICGAEALSSLLLRAQAGDGGDWSMAPGGPVSLEALRQTTTTERMRRYGLTEPILNYPLYENRLRAELGQSFEVAQRWSGEIYAAFATVAAENPAAWSPEPKSPEAIATPTAKNRPIAFPYPLWMTANPRVDQAAAVLLMDTEKARALGIPPSRWVHVWGGAGAADSHELLDRVSFGRAPGLTAAFDAALGAAGRSLHSIDVLDLYSCFPIVPKLAVRQLRIAPGRPLSATGGLTSFGGPGNAYSLHALVAVVGRLRAGAQSGLVYGNGEYVTKHQVVLLGRDPLPQGHVGRVEPVVPQETQGPVFAEAPPAGPGVIETFTVAYDREGQPARGYVVGRLADDRRFAANVEADDKATLFGLTDPAREAVGRSGTLSARAGRSLFRLA